MNLQVLVYYLIVVRQEGLSLLTAVCFHESALELIDLLDQLCQNLLLVLISKHLRNLALWYLFKVVDLEEDVGDWKLIPFEQG